MAKILHAQRPRDHVAERLVDIAAGELCEDRAERVEVPVAIAPRGARRLGVPWWLDGLHPWRLVTGRMVDAGARRQQIVDRRLLLDRAEPLDVVDAERVQRQLQVDAAVLDIIADQGRQKTLADRMAIEAPGDVAPARHLAAALHDHYRVGGERPRVLKGVAQPFERPAGRSEVVD